MDMIKGLSPHPRIEPGSPSYWPSMLTTTPMRPVIFPCIALDKPFIRFFISSPPRTTVPLLKSGKRDGAAGRIGPDHSVTVRDD